MLRWALSISNRIYRLLLIAYPAEFRHEYGRQMAQVFGDRCLEGNRRRGIAGLMGVWVHTLLDWAATAPAEHLDVLWQDLHYGVRMLGKSPGFTAAAVLSLALGIGATTAIFSAVNAVLLRPLPYRDPDRLVNISEITPNTGRRWFAVAPANFLDWREQNRVFENMAAIRDLTVTLASQGDTAQDSERVRAQRVSASFFRLLGVDAALGRTLMPEEDRPGGEPVVVLSHSLWKRRYGSDPSLIGRTLKLDSVPYTVIGVLPAGFRFFVEVWTGLIGAGDVELWLGYPFESDPPTERRAHRLRAVARLKPGVMLEQAQAEMDTIARRIDQAYPEMRPRGAKQGWGVNLTPLDRYFVRSDRASLLVLLGAVGLLLLIACANVANLLLVRAAARQREMGIRAALGAGRRRLIRQLLTESVLLSSLGAIAGLLLAVWGADSLAALSPGKIARLDEIGLDVRVVGFTLLIALITGVLFGLAPAFVGSKLDLIESLKKPTAIGHWAAGRGRWPRNLLLIGQMALSLVLLIGSGLLVNSFLRLQRVRLGFDPENLLTMQISRFRTKAAALTGKNERGFKLWTLRPEHQAFFEQVLRRIEVLPGVESAAAVDYLPAKGGGWSMGVFRIEGRPESPGDIFGAASFRPMSHVGVTPGYFHTMRIALLKGRYFTERDVEGGPRFAIISDSLARRYWPGPDGRPDPIGERVRIQDGVADPERSLEIVGVVADVRQTDLRTEPDLVLYVPMAQRARTYVDWQIGFRQGMDFVVRTTGDPMRLAPAVSATVREVDPDQPVENIATMEELVARSVGPLRSAVWLLGLFAAIALLLSCVGIYGVVSYSAAQRHHEIGVRMALGAQPRDVLQLVLRQGIILSLAGLVLGVAGAMALTRILSSLLYGVKPTDPATVAGVCLLFLAVALAASYIPARRTSEMDPMAALRHE